MFYFSFVTRKNAHENLTPWAGKTDRVGEGRYQNPFYPTQHHSDCLTIHLFYTIFSFLKQQGKPPDALNVNLCQNGSVKEMTRLS